MTTITARKFFSETVAIGATAVSMASLMRAAGWGYVPGANNAIGTQPSLDSFAGDGASVIPTNDLYVGHDQYVRDSAGAGPPRTYKGVLAAAGVPFSLNDYTRGIVDTEAVYFYSPSGAQDLEIVFQGI